MNAVIKSKKRLVLFCLVAFLLAVIFYVGICFFIATKREKAFDKVQVGNTESLVIDLLGEPSVREQQGVLFNRYATAPCLMPCVERLWFENRLALDVEAWSVELDQSRRVVNKYHWVSP